MESIKTVITEGKKQQTSVQFGSNDGSGIKDENIENKAQSALEGGLKNDIAKENKNPQGEGGKEAIPDIQKHPKLSQAVVAGIMGAGKIGIGAKKHVNKNIKYTPPAPATK